MVEQLKKEVNTDVIKIDQERLTALVILGIRNKNDFGNFTEKGLQIWHCK